MATTTATPPPYRIEHCTPSQITTWMTLVNKVFLTPSSNESQSLLSAFYPTGITPQIQSWGEQIHLSALTSPEENDYYLLLYPSPSANLSSSSTAAAAAADDSDPKPIAAARWTFSPALTASALADQETSAATSRAQDASTIPGVRHEILSTFREAQLQSRMQHMSDGQNGVKAFMYLKVLAVDPGWQRRRAGRALVRWGLEKARERGVGAYLESSVVGRGLYRSCGFEGRGVLGFDARRFEGVEEGFEHLAMVWEGETDGGGK